MFLFFYQFVSLAALGLFFFIQNRAALFLPYDGAYMQQLAKFHFEWSVPTTQMILNPLQGLGGMTFPLNFWFSPASLLTFLLKGATPNAVLYYTCITLEFFASMWFLSYALGASRRVRAFASWMGTLLVTPFLVPPVLNNLVFYPISGIFPSIIEHIAFSNIIIALLLRLRSTKSILSAALALLVFIVSLVGFPFSAVLSFPLLAVFFFYALSGKPFALKARRFSIGCVLGFIILAGLPMVYIAALLLPTVPSFFNPELIYGRPSWVFISILFHIFFNLGWMSSVVFLTGIVGGVMAWRYANGLLRAVARIYVIYALALVATGILLTFVITWYRGPTLLYFEWFTWPLIFVYASFLWGEVFRRLGSLIPLQLRTRFAVGRIAPSTLFVLVAPILIFLVLSVVNRPKDIRALPVPPKVTPLVDVLKSRCALNPGDPWRGSVATFTGLALPEKGTSWPDNVSYDCTLWQETGNDHRAVGLWWHGIPTLFTYDQYMNPEYYYLMTRLFASERDFQQRSVVVLTQPDARLLGLFGVRYVVTQDELNEKQPARLIQRYLPWDGFSTATAKPVSGKSQLLLYEIDRPNLGNFSPTKQWVEATAAGTLAKIQDLEFQPTQNVVLSKPIEGVLMEASDTAFIWEKDGISVRAQSKGQSLLVLPLQYSHCLEIKSKAATNAKENLRLVRADLVLTGVVFSGPLDAKIFYNFGPFSGPFGRIQDYLEAKQMQLGADVRSADKGR